MFESLVDLVGRSEWPYAIVFAVAALDAIVPVVPSEAAVVTAAALATSGRLSLAAVVGAAAAGAFIGDNGGYVLGHVSRSIVRRVVVAVGGRRRLDWAADALHARGGTIVLVSRFIPGGRTATMLAAGATGFPWTRFARVDVVAASLWASFSAALGVAGGLTFRTQPLYAVATGLGLAGSLTIAAEVLRRARLRSRRSRAVGHASCGKAAADPAEPPMAKARGRPTLTRTKGPCRGGFRARRQWRSRRPECRESRSGARGGRPEVES